MEKETEQKTYQEALHQAKDSELTTRLLGSLGLVIANVDEQITTQEHPEDNVWRGYN